VDREVNYAYSIVVPDDEDKAIKSRGEKRFNILYQGTSVALRTFHLPTLGRMLLTEMESQRFTERKDAIYVNMGLVRRNGRTALLPANMLDSLSSLERPLSRSPLTLPTDRFVAIDSKTGKVVPIRRRLKVPRNAIEKLEEMFPSTGSAYRRPVEEPSDVDLVFAYSLEEPGVASRAAMLHRVAGGMVWNIRLLAGTALDGLARLLQDATCYELNWGEPREVVQQIQDVLESGPEAPNPA
jgi:hypothetical protein